MSDVNFMLAAICALQDIIFWNWSRPRIRVVRVARCKCNTVVDTPRQIDVSAFVGNATDRICRIRFANKSEVITQKASAVIVDTPTLVELHSSSAQQQKCHDAGLTARNLCVEKVQGGAEAFAEALRIPVVRFTQALVEVQQWTTCITAVVNIASHMR